MKSCTDGFSQGLTGDSLSYLHLLVESGYDHLAATGGDFSQAVLEARKEIFIGEPASYGSFLVVQQRRTNSGGE